MYTIINKKNITRLILVLSMIIFGFLWKPESQSAQIGQYFIIGNILLFFLLMEILPLWFSYQYRIITRLLKHFSDSYDDPLDYSYTHVVVIKSDIHNTENTSYLTQTHYISDKSFFTIYHEGNLYEFSTDIIKQKYIIDLVSVIIYYLKKDVPYEILHQHSKRLKDSL